MPPKRRCSCKRHAEYSGGTDFTIYKHDGKKMKRSCTDLLQNNGDLFPHSTYICSACCEYAEQHLAPPPSPHKNRHDIIKTIEERQFNPQQLEKLAYTLGQSVFRNIGSDAINSGQQYKDDTYLMAFRPNGKYPFSEHNCYLKENTTLVNFIKGASGLAIAPSKQTDTIPVMRAVEHIYSASQPSFVGPMSFGASLVTYLITGSKGALAIQSAGSAAGSYTTLNKWMKTHAIKELQCPKECDVVTFFDNNQVIQRKWRVQSNFKCASSVFTNIIHIVPDPVMQLQKRADLSPVHWLRTDNPALTQFASKMSDNFDEHKQHFRKYRDEFIAMKITKVFSEVRDDGLDHIDMADSDAAPIPQQSDDRYTFVSSGHVGAKPKVTMGDPCFENPCSYESVQKVFDHISDLCDLDSGAHSWTFVGCDGLPYTLGSRILENVFRCPDCPREFEDECDFSAHRDDFEHGGNVSLHHCRKYKNIILLPGLGHYEINMVKAVFKLLWPVCIVDLAKMLEFKTTKALASCENAAGV
ncbi:uncharacterized protein [Argopecten irradians]|uniref:uncharacterized protein n=1 Tax=Argopecten irradians TaxID=31199 RepID=UPI0037176684